MTATLVILATAVTLGFDAPQQQQQQQQPPAAVKPDAPAQADAAKTVMFIGCVVPAPDLEDMFQLVAAEPEPGRPVGTSGTSPAWTVPGYLLLGSAVSFADHANKTVEITATIEPPGAPVEPDPKKAGDTTTRTGQAAVPTARLQVQSAKVIAATCTPKKHEQDGKGK